MFASIHFSEERGSDQRLREAQRHLTRLVRWAQLDGDDLGFAVNLVHDGNLSFTLGDVCLVDADCVYPQLSGF